MIETIFAPLAAAVEPDAVNWADNQLSRPVMFVKPRFFSMVVAICKSVLPAKSLAKKEAANVAGAVVLTSS